MTTIRLSLISHTNVGKTTLARTLLRRDIGEVRDQAHVTELAEVHTLVTTEAGDGLLLWDTPGFGDSMRLIRRLRQSGNPLGWLLSQVWDRYADRPFWSSQQAIRNVREEADVVLYLANASEDPVAAGYIAPEMEILGWIGKPVVVLLNQLGPPRGAEREAHELGPWTALMAQYPVVRDVLPFDAFARCWVQEHVLLRRITAVLPPEDLAAMDLLAAEWCARNERVFTGSMAVLARQLTATAADHEKAPVRSLADSARVLLGQISGGGKVDPVLDRAMTALASRADVAVRAATDELIVLHGLSGSAGAEILQRMGSEFDVEEAADPAKAGMLGGVVSGTLGGLAADLAAGGLTFGAGALVGGILGAAGGHGLARAYNMARGDETTLVRWSPAFMTSRVTAAVLRYLAVAHYGRGRGDYVQAEYPAHWRPVVESAVATEAPRLERIFAGIARGAAADVDEELRSLLADLTISVLRVLYPEAL